jgi:hypothetical protein
VAKSVGQSKPPAHAQYFEQASAPVKNSQNNNAKQSAPNRKSSVQPQHSNKSTKTKQIVADKPSPFQVININIENGQP